MAEKRKRGQNFSLEEKDKLIKLLLLHKDIVLNKKTDGATNESKNDAWMAITNSFNSTSNAHRNKESLIKLWDKLKSESKIYYSKIRNNNIQTGGGPSTIKFDPVLEQVASILGRGCSGILGVPDSDLEISLQADSLPKVIKIMPNCDTDNNIINIEKVDQVEVIDLQVPIQVKTPLRAPRQVELISQGDDEIKILTDEPHIQDTQEAHKVIKNKTPFWSRRRPKISQLNECSETPVSSSINKLYQKKEKNEDIKEQILREELEYKRKLYELQLQAATKEVQIKTAILYQINSEGFSLKNLYGGQQTKDNENC